MLDHCFHFCAVAFAGTVVHGDAVCPADGMISV